MPDPAFPCCKTGKQEQERRKRQQTVPFFAPVQQKQERVILCQRIGNHERADKQYPPAIDIDRVFPVFPCAVRKYVENFQSFQSKEAHGGKEQKETAKYRGSAEKHEQYRKDFCRCPCHMAGPDTVGEHDARLQHPADARKFNAAA